MRNRNRRRKELSPAEEKVKFIKHLTSFLIVNFVMLMINALSGTIRNWLPVILFWGIGLAFHFVKAYGIGRGGIGSKAWENKMLNKGNRTEYEDDEFLDLKDIEKEPRKNWKEEDLV